MELNYKNKRFKQLPGYVYGDNGTPYTVPTYYNGFVPFYNDPQFYNNAGLSPYGRKPMLTDANRVPILNNRSPFGANLASGAPQILSSGIQFAGAMGDAFSGVKSSDTILNETGSKTVDGGDFGYQKMNDIDYDGQMTEARKQAQASTLKTTGAGAAAGASVGAVFGPVGGLIGGAVGALGGLIGGLFGGAHKKRKMMRRLEEARIRKLNTDMYNQSSAQSNYMITQYNKENGDTQDDLLYANRGKDSGYSTDNIPQYDNVYTSLGKVKAQPNARVAKGESIIDNIDDINNTTGHVVKTGVEGKDTNLANLQNNTVVLGQDVDWRTGKTFKDQSLPYTLALEKINKKYEHRTNDKINELRGTIGKDSDKIQQQEVNKLKQPIVEKLKDLSDQQRLQHQYSQDMQNYNKLPGYVNGRVPDGYIEPINWMSNAVPMGVGMLTSLGQYMQAKNQSIHTPDIYAGNPYETAGLQELAKIRVNPYKALSDIYKQEAYNRYNINRAGGLSGAQKYLANIAIGANTQDAISDTLQKAQDLNNQYKSRWAEAAINAGNASAQRRQSANQYKAEYAAAAHAARQQGMQMGIRNFLDYVQQYAANEYKRKTGNGMLGLYQQKIDLDKDGLRNNNKPDNNKTIPTYTPTTTPTVVSTPQSNYRTAGYPTLNVDPYNYQVVLPTNFMHMPPISYKWNNMF